MKTDRAREAGGLVPRFIRKLADPDCSTVLLLGCGGGFDFVHGMLLYPELVRMGKSVVIGSYSFGRPPTIGDPAPVVWSREDAIVKLVTAASVPDEIYSPEVHLASFLDGAFPKETPHSVYAYYARDFSVPVLRELYQYLVDLHDVDTILLIDGGTDSLMRGDEAGIGDPIEDATSVAAVAGLSGVARRMLLTVGLGMDRYNGVSDASSLRAVAELTADGGFLGSIGIDPADEGFAFYRDAVAHIYDRQRFRSTATGFVISAAEGYFGGDSVPPPLERKLTMEDRFYVSPLMSTLYAFDVAAVARRSLLVDWISGAANHVAVYEAISAGRRALGDALRGVEEIPATSELVGRYGVDFTRLVVTDREDGDAAMLEELVAADDDPDGGDQPVRGIDLARGFFHEIVEPLIADLAPGLRYSAALIGPGSEVLGYDDETSADHHWGPRVQIFCDEADAVSRREGLTRGLADRLPRRYGEFPTNFSAPDPEDHGTQHLIATEEGPVNHRVEILGLGAWLCDYIGVGGRATAGAAGVVVVELDALDWLTLPQQKLLTITAGSVFRDDDGRLAALRSALGWFPDDVWRYLMASVWQRIGQEEHLVGRAGQTGDETGARVIAARLVRDAMRLCLLAARRYAPYPKWLGRAFRELEVATVLGPLLDEVLDAPDWRRRDAALVPVWEELAHLHNSLGVTPPLPTHATRFFGRPFHVIAIHGFAESLLSSITADWLSPSLRSSPVGGIDLLSDNTDLLEDPVFRTGVRAMLASRHS